MNCQKYCGICTDGGTGGGNGGNGGNGNGVKCGLPKIARGRVVGGVNAVPGSWPWQIGMYKSGRFFCGGALVNAKWIVTASHCIYRQSSSSMKVKLGDHDIRNSDGNEQYIQVKRIVQHPSYNPRALNNDIALLELDVPAKFNDRVQPVCLPSKGEAPAVGSKCTITGWGKIRHPGNSHPILQQLDLTIQSKSACHSKNSKYMPITDQMVCGANLNVRENQSGCHGDSGGPFVCKQSDGSYKLHGAVSWGSPRCDIKDSYTVFARVAQFRDWIDRYINN